MQRLNFFSNVGQRSRSKPRDKNVESNRKGIVIKNTLAPYESPMSYFKNVICRVNVFKNVGLRSQSWSGDQNLWYHQKGLVIRNTLAKYKSPMSNCKKVMCKVKVSQM